MQWFGRIWRTWDSCESCPGAGKTEENRPAASREACPGGLFVGALQGPGSAGEGTLVFMCGCR